MQDGVRSEIMAVGERALKEVRRWVIVVRAGEGSVGAGDMVGVFGKWS